MRSRLYEMNELDNAPGDLDGARSVPVARRQRFAQRSAVRRWRANRFVIGFSTAEPAMWSGRLPATSAVCDQRSPPWWPNGCLGHSIRAFTAKGEGKTYRERLTYFSDTDMTLAYTHVEGIEGPSIMTPGRVSRAEQGSAILMSASSSARADRPRDIASGTEAIFKDAVVALAAAVEAGPPQTLPHRCSRPRPFTAR